VLIEVSAFLVFAKDQAGLLKRLVNEYLAVNLSDLMIG